LGHSHSGRWRISFTWSITCYNGKNNDNSFGVPFLKHGYISNGSLVITSNARDTDASFAKTGMLKKHYPTNRFVPTSPLNISVSNYPICAKEKLPLLERLDFITSKQNIMLSGNPGTGKTHIVIGLGLKAFRKGIRCCSQLYTAFLLNYVNRNLQKL